MTGGRPLPLPRLSVVLTDAAAAEGCQGALGLEAEVVVASADGPAGLDEALARTRSPLVLVLEDAVAEPAALWEAVALLESLPGCDLLYGQVAGRPAPASWLPHGYAGGRDEFMEHLLVDHLPLAGTIVRQGVVRSIAGFDEGPELTALHGWAWLARAAHRRRTAYVPHVLAHEGPALRPPAAFAALARDRLAIWSHWLLEAAEPPYLDGHDFHRMETRLRADAGPRWLPEQAVAVDAAKRVDALHDAFAARMSKRYAAACERADPFTQGVRPWPLDGARQVVALLQPRWHEDGWLAVVQSFAAAVTPEADVTLAIWLDPTQGVAADEAVARVMAALGEAAEAAPDMLLVPEPLSLPELARLYEASDVVVAVGDATARRRAERMGKRVLTTPTREAWASALAVRP